MGDVTGFKSELLPDLKFEYWESGHGNYVSGTTGVLFRSESGDPNA